MDPELVKGVDIIGTAVLCVVIVVAGWLLGKLFR